MNRPPGPTTAWSVRRIRLGQDSRPVPSRATLQHLHRPRLLAREVLEQRHQVVAPVPVAQAELDELADLLDDLGPLGHAGNPDGTAPPHLQQPSSRSTRRALRTVLVFTPSTAARSFACGILSPGRASPWATALRSSNATCWCRRAGSLRSTAANRSRASSVLSAVSARRIITLVRIALECLRANRPNQPVETASKQAPRRRPCGGVDGRVPSPTGWSGATSPHLKGTRIARGIDLSSSQVHPAGLAQSGTGGLLLAVVRTGSSLKR